MAQRQSSTLAILVWFIGLLGCLGYVRIFYPFGFIPVVIPLIFWLLGNNFTKVHCRAYFNVLITAFILHVAGRVIDWLFNKINLNIFSFVYIGLFYFAVLCIVGLVKALDHKRFNPELTIHLF